MEDEDYVLKIEYLIQKRKQCRLYNDEPLSWIDNLKYKIKRSTQIYATDKKIAKELNILNYKINLAKFQISLLIIYGIMLMNLKKFNYKLKNKKWSVSQHNQFVSIDQYFTTHIRKWNFKLCRSLLYLWFSFSIHKKVWAKFQHVTIYLSMHGIGIRSVEDLKTTSVWITLISLFRKGILNLLY